MFTALGAVLGLLHPVAGGVLRSGLKFQTCTNILTIFFNNSGNFWVSPTYSDFQSAAWAGYSNNSLNTHRTRSFIECLSKYANIRYLGWKNHESRTQHTFCACSYLLIWKNNENSFKIVSPYFFFVITNFLINGAKNHQRWEPVKFFEAKKVKGKGLPQQAEVA